MKPLLRAGLLALLALPLAGAAEGAGRSGRLAWCGTEAGGTRDAVWASREALARRPPVALGRQSAQDVGQVAVLQDEGDLALLRNPVDLQGVALRFTPQAGGGYSVDRTSLPLAAEPGVDLALSDDDTRSVRLPFPFPFYGQSYGEAFVNSDGNLTFGRGDDASTRRSLGRFVSGPPRVGPMFADLDPGSAGSVTLREQGDRWSVAWSAVPRFEQADKNTFQVTLYPDGRIDFVYAAELSAGFEEAVVGVAPGAERGGLRAVDFSGAVAVEGGGALAESFRDSDAIDLVAAARKFYATHPDDYRQLVFFTSRRLVPSGVFAYEQTVQNRDEGIGDRIYDGSADYGSRGRLESIAMMDAVSKYPDDLERRFLGEDSALAVLAHEVGHRWLARARFLDGGTSSGELLGRDDVHWSFFLDSDASHLEGNDVQDLGGGRFRTVDAGTRYSPLDQYLMGVRLPEEVPPFFFVRSPTGAGEDRGRDPKVGVEFGGTRKDVTIADVIAALGPRRPAGAPPQALRQAFIHVAVGGPADPSAIAWVDRIRAAFEAYFSRSTDGRFAVDPRLD